MISYLCEEVPAEHILVREDGRELCTNTTKDLDLISICLESMKTIMLPAVLSNEVAQIQTYLQLNVITNGCNPMSNVLGLSFFRFVDRFAIAEQNPAATFTPEHMVAALMKRREQSMMKTYPSSTYSVFSRDTSSADFEGKRRLSRPALHHERQSSTHFGY